MLLFYFLSINIVVVVVVVVTIIVFIGSFDFEVVVCLQMFLPAAELEVRLHRPTAETL